MYTVFLAGGMASGKSTVARMLEEKGAYRIDLDCISRDVLAPGSGCVQEIVRAFGEDVVDQKTGRLNRHQLAMRAFATPTAAKKLEAIEMPYIIRTLKDTLVEVSLKEDAPAVCVVEVPLLDRIESLLTLADEVVAVVSPYELRKKRAQMRGVSSKDFEQRVAGQPSDEYLRSKAATVIDNSEDEDLLATYVNAWWDTLMTKLDMHH